MLSELSLDDVRMKPKEVDKEMFARVLRLLARRCVSPAHKTELRAAVQAWIDNEGKLPDGIVMVEGDDGVQAAADSVETPPVVPSHKVLVSTYELKSKAFMLTYNSESFSLDTWAPFLQHMENLHLRFGSRAFSCCLEQSEHAAPTTLAAPRFHTHGYLLWTDGVGYRSDNLEDFRFQGTLPRVDKCTVGTNSRTPRQAALHGLWYVTVKKSGTRKEYTNFKPWVDYKPAKEWLISLYDNHKLDHRGYLQLSMQFRTGHSARRREVMDILRDEEEERVRKHVKVEEAAASATKPLEEPRTSPAIDRFVNSFASCSWRRPILVIVGGTQFGKTALGRYVLKCIAEKLGLPGYLEVTMEESSTLDFSELRVEEHAGVLLDGVADVLLLKPHRESLQGQPKVCKGGKSNTMMYSYAFTLARRAVVVTMDLSARNLHLLRSDHWLADRDNVVLEWLAAPVFGSALPCRSPRDQMMSWSVAQVASFFESKDAAALGDILAANSVQGADLLKLTAESLQEGLRFNSFGAMKVCKLRDSFLQLR